MRALFWKEGRENLKWALLAAVCVAGAMFYGLRPDTSQMGYYNEDWRGLLSKQALLVSSFGFPLIGAALGFLQILTELRRDQWAFLVHRPITRTQIFWGKALPGLILYLLATLLPYLIVACWVSLPGSLAAPFDWRMTQVGLMDAFTGLGFYFAALWIGISPGRWYGPRLLPLVAASYGALLTKGWEPIGYASQIAALTLVALILAAWAAFQTFGTFKREKWWGKIGTVLSLLLAVFILNQWVLAGWKLMFPPKPRTSTDYLVSTQGELLRVSQTGQRFSKVETLEGKELKPEGKESFDRFGDFLRTYRVNLSLREPRDMRSYRSTYFLFQKVNSNTQDTFWYFVTDFLQFVSYDRGSKLLTGYLGPQGFVAPSHQERAGRFALNRRLRSQSGGKFLVSLNALYRLDLYRKEVTEIFHPEPGETLLGGTIFSEFITDSNEPQKFISATTKSLNLHDPDGKVLWSFPRPENLERFSSAEISRMQDRSRYFILYKPDQLLTHKQEPIFYELKEGGEIFKQLELPIPPDPKLRFTVENAIAAILMPFGQTLWEQCVYSSRCALGLEKYTPLWKAKADYRNHTLKFWALSIATGLVAALACLPLLRRLTDTPRERIAWLLFFLFYGLAGVVVFLIAQDWPRRVRCPNCQKKRSLERSNCESCGAPWPKPEADGTQIFESEELKSTGP